MPKSLPVPSKGALRALRKLALGTSCTVAFSTGLLTEDRRRRIHYVQEVQENAKKLKSSKKYYSAGTTSLEALEDQTLRYRDEALLPPSNVLKSTASAALHPSTTENSPRIKAPVEKEEQHKPSQMKITRICPPNVSTSSRSWTSRGIERTGWKSRNPQHEIASDVINLLEQQPADINGATELLLEALGEELPIHKSGLQKELVDVSARLSTACQRLSMFSTSSRILDVVLNHGLISEEDFHSFQPLDIIRHLVSAKGITDYSFLDPEKLQKACSIFLTKFTEKPKSMSLEMRSIGEKLCQATCVQNKFDLTLALFTRLEVSRAGKPPTAVEYLIRATHAKGLHKKMSRHFQRLYTQTSPDQIQFLQITSLVIDSMIILGKLDEVEHVLAAASQIAKAGGLDTSTTWYLRVLGEEYRTHKNLGRLQDLFKRLEPLFSYTRHPQAIYGLMIQYCIEAREEELAISYYMELRESHDRCPEDLRIYGHFALGKAYQGDWDGVKSDFHEMKQAVPGNDEDYSAMFSPILKEFAKSYSVDEVEDFIQYFIVEFHLKTTFPIMNTMIGVYSKAHELDAIFRWITYASADGCAVDSRTFNSILRNCVSTFQFTFGDSYRLYVLVRNIRSDLVNNDSLSILRSVAVSRSPDERTRVERLQLLRRLDDPVETSGSNEAFRAMTMTSAQGNDVAVLKIYKGAQRDHVRLQPRHLDLAVRASLRLHGDNITETAQLIRGAQEMGNDIVNAVATVFVHQMSHLYEAGSEVERLAEVAEQTITSFIAAGLKVPQKAITHTASIFQRRGRSRMAIDFWDSMSRRLHIPGSKFDLATITTLLKAYIGLKDGQGIRWGLDLLSANNLSPDRQLKETLREARKEAGQNIDRHRYSKKLQEWWHTLDEAHQEVKEMREKSLLTKKEVTFKVIKIMETAVEDQALTGSIEQVENGEELEDLGQQRLDSGQLCQTGSEWVEPHVGSSPVSKHQND